MVQTYRLVRGGRIDRSKPIAMRFNGKELEAFAGDTVASALLANGIHFAARSFKFHRPRGSSATEARSRMRCCRSIAEAAGSIRTTARPPSKRSMACRCARRTIGRRFNSNVGAVNGALSPLFVAGFYYKTFMWPRSFWDRVYEPAIRAAAGLGRAPSTADPDRYQHTHAHCDVLVVGAGPAGLAAALAASEAGKRVILADEQAEMGGALLHELTSTIDGKSAWAWLEDTLARLASRGTVTLLSAHDRLRLLQPQSRGPGAAGNRPSCRPASRPAARAPVAGARA
jgi:sarcosine oxidase subunit alpha